jgi:hypothetical protein
MSYQTSLLDAKMGHQFFELRLRGYCQNAAKADLNRDRSRIYFIEQVGGTSAVKIGFTGKRSAANRLAGMQGGNPQPLRIILEVPGSLQHEELLHCVLTPHWMRGEWFRLDRVSAAFIDAIETSGLPGAISEYLRAIEDKDHATMVRRVMREFCSGPVHNIAFANWGKTSKPRFETKQLAKHLNGAKLNWTPRVVGSA